jgi:hypothetical protein
MIGEDGISLMQLGVKRYRPALRLRDVDGTKF